MGTMKKVIINRFIVADPSICHGKPTFKGTRVMVWQILSMLKDGADTREIIEAFPHLQPAHIKAALEYASSLTKEGYAIIPTSPQAAS